MFESEILLYETRHEVYCTSERIPGCCLALLDTWCLTHSKPWMPVSFHSSVNWGRELIFGLLPQPASLSWMGFSLFKNKEINEQTDD